MVAVDAIRSNPYQPRESFAEEALDELAASIRDKGLLQPLLVRRTAGGYELIAGERRLRAAQRAGLSRVPVVFRDGDDRDSLELALIENLQREDLNPIEEAKAYERLIREFGLRQEDVALRVGKSRSAVANSIRLLHLPLEIRTQVERGELSAGHARSLLALPSIEAQSELADDVARRRLSVRDTELLARKRAGDSQDVDLDRRAVETDLARALGTKVRLLCKSNGSGRIQIDFYSLAELDGLIARLSSL